MRLQPDAESEQRSLTACCCNALHQTTAALRRAWYPSDPNATLALLFRNNLSRHAALMCALCSRHSTRDVNGEAGCQDVTTTLHFGRFPREHGLGRRDGGWSAA